MAPPWQRNLTVERARSICPRSSPGRAALAAARSPAVGRPALRPRDKAMPHAPPQRRRASRGEGPRVERSACAVIHSTAALSRRRPSRHFRRFPTSSADPLRHRRQHRPAGQAPARRPSAAASVSRKPGVTRVTPRPLTRCVLRRSRHHPHRTRPAAEIWWETLAA